MLQRSPSYIVSLPGVDPIAGILGRVLPERLAYPIVRWKNVMLALGIYGLSRRRPATMKRLIRRGLTRRLPPGFDIDTHFKPSYEPWDQRMCLVPDGDLFESIASGRVTVVTDRIETFTEKGLEACVRLGARGRHGRHRHRAEDGAVRVDPAQRRRQPRGPERDACVQGDAAQRRAQHGVLVRLHEPVVDARVGPHLPAGLRGPQPHGPLRLHHVHAAQARPGPRRRAVRRPHLGLRAEGHRPVPEAGRARPLAQRAELRARVEGRLGARRSTIPHSSSGGLGPGPGTASADAALSAAS